MAKFVLDDSTGQVRKPNLSSVNQTLYSDNEKRGYWESRHVAYGTGAGMWLEDRRSQILQNRVTESFCAEDDAHDPVGVQLESTASGPRDSHVLVPISPEDK